MKYLIGLSPEEAAKTRDRAIAIMQGCSGLITEYWFQIIKHPEREEWGMTIPEGEEDKLTTEEISTLKTEEYMDEDGWFPEPPFPLE
jgi:hypothetical protein